MAEKNIDNIVITNVGIAIILYAPFNILPVIETSISAVSVCFEKQQHSITRKTNRMTRITIPPAMLLNSKHTKENINKLIVIPSIVRLMAPEAQHLQQSNSRILRNSDNPDIPNTTPTNMLNLSL